MRPSHVEMFLRTCYAANQPVNIKGSPGVGKTSVVEQVSRSIDGQCWIVGSSEKDRVDFTGVPYVVDRMTKWATPDFFPRDPEAKGFFVLDDFTSAARELQPAFHQFVLERKLGDYELPRGVLPVITSNLTTDKAFAGKMSTALSNRVSHALFELHLDDWSKWAVANDVLPIVVAFARFRPQLFAEGFDAKEEVNLTPRSLVKLSNILKTQPPREIEHALVGGTIGERHAAEFTGFIRVWRSLPSLDAILLNPATTDVPNDPATLFALAGGLARKSTEKNFDRVMTYADRMPKEWQTYLVKDAVNRDMSLQNTTCFINWASLNSSLMS